MILNFRNAASERFWFGAVRRKNHRRYGGAALRKLDMLDRAHILADLRAAPANRLKRLKGDRRGQHSIHLNDRWRICFVWTGDGAANVEIVDYH
jgi:proteic killer suppression protein